VLTFWNVFLVWVVGLALVLFGLWRVFEKAGRPGWAAVVPLYNLIVLLRLLDLPPWLLVFLLLPGLEFIAGLIVCVHLGAAFERGFWYRLGLFLLPPVFLPLLGLDGSTYRAPTPARDESIEIW
jgi:hypothetical protein